MLNIVLGHTYRDKISGNHVVAVRNPYRAPLCIVVRHPDGETQMVYRKMLESLAGESIHNSAVFEYNDRKIYGHVAPYVSENPHREMRVSLSLMKDAPNIACVDIAWPTPYAGSSNEQIGTKVWEFLKNDGFSKLEVALKEYVEWARRVAVLEERQRVERKLRFETLRKSGHRYLVVATVHPKAGGSDYTMELATKTQPTDEFVKSHLRKVGSAVLTDYKITAL
jgi:hypothetical protein